MQLGFLGHLSQKLGKLFLVLGWIGSSVSMSWAEGVKLKETLESFDMALLSNLHIKGEEVAPVTAFDPSQGDATGTFEISCNGASQTLKVNRADPILPRFVAGRAPHEYTEEGFYDLSHVKKRFVHLGPQFWRFRTDSESIEVDQEETVQRITMMRPTMRVYPVGDHHPASYFYRYILPLGRGYGQLVEDVIEQSEDASGVLHITANGGSFSPHPGKWEIEVDPSNDYLVRSATFTRNDANSPAIMVQTDWGAGILPNVGVSLYTGGTIYITSGYRLNVRVRQTAEIASELFIQSVEQAVKGAAEGSTIMDFTHPDESGLPVVMKVREILEP